MITTESRLKRNAYMVKYRALHPEQATYMKVYGKAWRIKNTDKKREQDAAWYLKNRVREMGKHRQKYWELRNPEFLAIRRAECKEKYAKLTIEEKNARRDKIRELCIKKVGIEEVRKRGRESARRYGFGPNRERYLICKRAAQMRRKYNTPETTPEQLQFVYERNIKQYGTLTCYLCALDGVKETSIKFGEDSIDHKIPVCRKAEFPTVNVGGTDNLDIVHKRCNSSKGTMTSEEWLVRK